MYEYEQLQMVLLTCTQYIQGGPKK